MEKNQNGKIIAIVALVIGVVGLSLGFAAFTTTLNISTVANVEVNGSNWDVGFSTNGTTIEDVTTAGTKGGVDNTSTANGQVDVTKYTISQSAGQNAVLHTTSGSFVTYTVNILNNGSLTAYLDSVNFTSPYPLSCAPASGTGSVIEGVATAGTYSSGGNSTAISDADCNAMFDVSLTIGGTEYTPTSTSFSGSIAAKTGTTPGSTTAVLKLAYNATNGATAAAALDGDIVVTVPSISVIYTSVNS